MRKGHKGGLPGKDSCAEENDCSKGVDLNSDSERPVKANAPVRIPRILLMIGSIGVIRGVLACIRRVGRRKGV